MRYSMLTHMQRSACEDRIRSELDFVSVHRSKAYFGH